MATATDSLNAILIHREDLNDELAVVRITNEERLVPEFKAGQFITLGMPKDAGMQRATGSHDSPESGRTKMLRRAYTIASSAAVRDYLEFFVTRIIDGVFTPQFWTYSLGERLWMDTRMHGEFTIDAAPAGKDVVFVSTGTGLAPFLSMIRTHWHARPWRRLVLVNGVRRACDLGYQEELLRLAAGHHGFRYVPLVSREPDSSTWNGERGRVQRVLHDATFDRIAGFSLDPNECHVFLCGNPAMIRDVSRLLGERGFVAHSKKQPGNLHTERYW